MSVSKKTDGEPKIIKALEDFCERVRSGNLDALLVTSSLDVLTARVAELERENAELKNKAGEYWRQRDALLTAIDPDSHGAASAWEAVEMAKEKIDALRESVPQAQRERDEYKQAALQLSQGLICVEGRFCWQHVHRPRMPHGEAT